MNKTLSVNIGGMAFKIDENAFQKLKNYLDAVKSRFQDTREQEEIVADIESRVAEIFSERISDLKEVIVMEDVDHMIAIMGEPTDIGETEEEMDPSGTRSSGRRRLFRNPDDKVLGGVASGLSAYFGITDPIWLRLIFVILTLVGVGAMIPIYILLWIIIPEAQTTAEKLQMRGEEANLSNIEKSFRDGMENLESSLKDLGSKKKIREAGNFFERLVEAFITVVRAIFMLAVKLIALILIIVGAVMFISLVISLLTSAAFIFPPLSSLAGLVISSSLITLLGIIGVLLLVGIPTLAVIYLGIRILLGQSAHIRGFGLGMLGFWIVGLILSAFVAFNIGKHFRENAKITDTLEFRQPTSDVLNIDIIDFDKSERYEDSEFIEYQNFDLDGLYITDDEVYLDDVDFYIERSKDDQFSLIQTTSSSGSTTSRAKEQAMNLQAGIVQTDSTLNIDGFFKISKDDRYRNQRIRLTLRVPDGRSIQFTPASYSFIRRMDRAKGNSNFSKTGNVWKMTEDGLKCQDCSEEEAGTLDAVDERYGDSPERIYEFRDFSKLDISGNYEVSIVQGETHKLSMRGRESSLDRIKVSKEDDRLMIDAKKFSMDKRTVYIDIVMPELKQLEIAGASELEVSGFNENEMDLKVAGATNASMRDIFAERLELTMAGACKVGISGSADYFEADMAGASELKAYDFPAKTADISMVGACTAKVHATDELEINMAGACQLFYKGDATVDTDKLGISNVTKID